MGHIFNHNITSDEVVKLKRMIVRTFIEDKNEYNIRMSSDIKNADLYRLYNIRGKKDVAEIFFNKIENKILRFILKQ
ncbi:MAG: hypothetical protein ACM3O3_01380 [Syntrophothermus sp.]